MSSGIPGHDGKDPPLAEQIAADVAELHAEGMGRNEIARALAVSPGTVSNAARIAGVEFDRSSTEVATRTRTEQLAEDRADLAAMSAAIARRAGRRLFMELGATVLDPGAVTALNRTFGTAVDKAIAAGTAVPDDSDQDEYRAARTWLEALHVQLEMADRGLLPTDEHGNTLLQYGPDDPNPTEEP